MPAKAKSDGVVEISAIQLRHSFISLKGISPLIMGNFKEIEKKATKLDPEEVVKNSLYVDEDGDYFVYSAAIRNCLSTAGSRFAGQKGTVLTSAIQIPKSKIKIISKTGWHREDHTVTNRTKGKTTAYRPVFDEWETEEFEVIYVANTLNHEMLLNLVAYAGWTTGIGVWRVEKKGSFGMFQIGYEYDAGLTKFSIVKENN